MEVSEVITGNSKEDMQSSMEFRENMDFTKVGLKERTRHMHGVCSYLGKYIPHTVELIIRKYFKQGDWVLDPFVGSGTTLLEANIHGLHSVGVELTAYGVLVSKVKTRKYNYTEVKRELLDIMRRTKGYCASMDNGCRLDGEKIVSQELSIESEYLNKWISKRALKEILFYREQIGRYVNQDIMQVLLCDMAKNSLQIRHYEIGKSSIKPYQGVYWCYRHKRRCRTVDSIKGLLETNTLDTIKRIREYMELRKEREVIVIQGDSREVELPVSGIDGVITSPPYFGMLDYHDANRCAYELFGFPKNEDSEIGSCSKGKGKQALERYKEDMVKVLSNIWKYLKPGAKLFVVVEDRYNLFPDIAKRSGYEVKGVVSRRVLNRVRCICLGEYWEQVYCLRKGVNHYEGEK